MVRVEVTSDLSYCKIYVSAMEGLEKAKNAVQGLKSAAGFIRHELGSRLSLRHVPALQFLATDSIEYSANISRMLHDLRSEEEDGESVSYTHLQNLLESGRQCYPCIWIVFMLLC